jgi:hypothetical protein
MITRFKLFESSGHYLLCVKDTDPDYYWKFTKGKKYKLYLSSIGLRIKDDNGRFDRLVGVDTDDYWKRTRINGIFVWEYAGGIFTNADTIEEYEVKTEAEIYNL